MTTLTMSQSLKILASTWSNGVFVLENNRIVHELPERTVRGLSDDCAGGVFAVVDDHQLYQRNASGEWNCIASSEYPLSVTFAVDDKVYVGTDDAHVLILDSQNRLNPIDCFESIEGRDSWFAGTAVIDGIEVGPPLGVRSLSGAANGRIFANVHVGGIPRSIDGGSTWKPTIDVNLDAHEVRVSPFNDNLIVAATASGLCASWDGGDSWSVHSAGLHAPNCSAVVVTEQHIFVSASETHFSEKGAIYRRSVKPINDRLIKVDSGLPKWLGGIVDTSCIASSAGNMALISASGDIFESNDAGFNWRKRKGAVSDVSSVFIISKC